MKLRLSSKRIWTLALASWTAWASSTLSLSSRPACNAEDKAAQDRNDEILITKKKFLSCSSDYFFLFPEKSHLKFLMTSCETSRISKYFNAKSKLVFYLNCLFYLNFQLKCYIIWNNVPLKNLNWSKPGDVVGLNLLTVSKETRTLWNIPDVSPHTSCSKDVSYSVKKNIIKKLKSNT